MGRNLKVELIQVILAELSINSSGQVDLLYYCTDIPFIAYVIHCPSIDEKTIIDFHSLEAQWRAIRAHLFRCSRPPIKCFCNLVAIMMNTLA